MTHQTSTTDSPVRGKMFLFRQPELLTAKDHGHLGLTPMQRPFDHVKDELAIPLTIAEFSAAQRHFPIVFSGTDENAMPLAVVGLSKSGNLFVDPATGNWDGFAYIPAYLRCYPFAFAGVESDQMAAVIDRSAATVQEDAQFPFFVDDKPSQATEEMMQFCAQYTADRHRTREFCQVLAREQLIVTQQATRAEPDSDEQVPLAEYHTVDRDAFSKLADEKITEYFRGGVLAGAYLQMYSIDNWQALLARQVRASQSAA